jgi:hypothetical protein
MFSPGKSQLHFFTTLSCHEWTTASCPGSGMDFFVVRPVHLQFGQQEHVLVTEDPVQLRGSKSF